MSGKTEDSTTSVVVETPNRTGAVIGDDGRVHFVVSMRITVACNSAYINGFDTHNDIVHGGISIGVAQMDELAIKYLKARGRCTTS